MNQLAKAAFVASVLVLALVVGLVVGCNQPEYVDAPMGAVGDTNFTNVVASGDISVGDDLTVTDDTTLSDDLNISGDLKVGDGTPTTTLNGEDAYVEGTFEVDGAVNLDGAVDMDSTLDVAGNVSDGAGAFTIADNTLVDGQANAVQLTVQEYTTPTNAALVVEDSGGTDVVSIHVAEAAAGSWDFIDVTDTTPILDGSDSVIGLDMNITGANHTGSTNVIYGIDLDLTTADADATEIAIELSDTDWDTGIQSAVDQEHIGLLTVDSAAIITSTDGALWTVGTSEIWFIYAVYCEVTTNFDCTGDDCTLIIGDGNDDDGFLVLTDAEMQASDAEFTGAPAGWKGLHTDTLGAYLSGLGPFVYDGTDTIDIKIEDNSDQSDPTAGAATCYVVYTRVQ